ncbi:MAG: hypothetical protein L3J57_01665 [Desulfuromusa sp.]|nr:hypothetical protein [Desulfuromusa sp.]
MALVDLVEGKVKDDSGKLNLLDDYLPAVEAALADYSKHRPKIQVADLPGSDSHDLILPAEWVPDFSAVRTVEYPVDNIPASQLSNDAWTLYRAPSGLQLRMLKDSVDTSESVRLSFTIMRAEADVPAADQDALACLAAAICCDTLANIFTQSGDSTIAADVVNYRSKGDEFARRGKQYRQRFFDHFGIKEGSTQPAMSTVAAPKPTERTRITH